MKQKHPFRKSIFKPQGFLCLCFGHCICWPGKRLSGLLDGSTFSASMSHHLDDSSQCLDMIKKKISIRAGEVTLFQKVLPDDFRLLNSGFSLFDLFHFALRKCGQNRAWNARDNSWVRLPGHIRLHSKLLVLNLPSASNVWLLTHGSSILAKLSTRMVFNRNRFPLPALIPVYGGFSVFHTQNI